MTNLYQSDPRTLSDAELETLSQELEDAYRCSGYEDDVWTDDAAEARYWQLKAELMRRWELAHPDWRPVQLNEYVKLALAEMSRCMDTSVRITGQFDAAFSGGQRIGDTIEVRRPQRFQA